MATLIAVYNSQGCVGRCDANCYEARHATCTCICGGRNHSAGKSRAMENVRDMVGLTEEDLARFAAAHKQDPKDLHVVDRVKIKSNRRARRIAKDKIAQPELPL